jgi:hypothetical protein
MKIITQLIITLVVLIVGGVIGYLYSYDHGRENSILLDNTVMVTNFEECVSGDNLVMESYPRQCRYEGKLFTENIGNELEKSDLIRISSPRPNQIITNPLEITGEARGYWFFEASFPIVITDWDGRIIAQHYIMTADDWMTVDFVSFSGELSFESPYNVGDPDFMRRGTLILQKDNPSGLPEHEDALEIPIRFE